MYLYAFKDYDDSSNNMYIKTDKECKELLEEIAENCGNEDGCKVGGKVYDGYYLEECILEILEDYGIKVEELEFETIKVHG